MASKPALDFLIRDAVPGDGALMGRLHAASWASAYRHFMPPAYLDAPEREAGQALHWTHELVTPVVRGGRGWIIEAGGEPAGFAWAQPGSESFAYPSPEDAGHLDAIHLLPSRVGGGFGRPFFWRALAALAAAGFTEATLGVYEENVRARGFYQAMGWREDGPRRVREFTWAGGLFSATLLMYRGPTRPAGGGG